MCYFFLLLKLALDVRFLEKRFLKSQRNLLQVKETDYSSADTGCPKQCLSSRSKIMKVGSWWYHT